MQKRGDGSMWPGFDRHLYTGTGFPQEVSDGEADNVPGVFSGSCADERGIGQRAGLK